jgi:hypothetical protein
VFRGVASRPSEGPADTLHGPGPEPVQKMNAQEALVPFATLVRRGFPVRAMTNVALHLRGTRRRLASWVVHDADNLEHAAAATAVRQATSVGDDLGLRPTVLTEQFSNGWH